MTGSRENLAKTKVVFSIGISILILIPLVSIIGIYSLSTPASAQTSNGWLQPTNLSNDNYNASYPWVANVGSNVYVAWTEEDHGIYFRASTNNGSSWNPQINLPALKLSAPGGTASYPIVYALNSDVYVVWSQSVNNELQIFFAGSTNNGSSFAAPIQLTAGNSENGWITPVIAAAGPYVYVAYTGSGKNSFVVSSDNYGVSWNPAYHYAITHEPQLAALGSNGYVVSDGLQYAVTHNGGHSWTEVLSSTDEGDEPWIAASGSDVYLVSQTKTNNSTIHFIVCTNYGMNCSPSLPGRDLAQSVGLNDTWEPQIIAAGNDVYLTYHTLSSPIQNYLRYSTNNGATWSPLIDLSGATRLVGWAPQLATTGCGGGYSCTGGSYVFTAWTVRDAVTSSGWSMFAAESTDYGQTWTSKPGVNVSGTGYGSSGPNDIATSSLAANGDHAFLVWEDNYTSAGSGIGQVIFSESNPSFTTVSSSTFSASSGYTTFTKSTTSSKSSISTTQATQSTTISLPPPTTNSSSGILPSVSQPDYVYFVAIPIVALIVAAAGLFVIIRRKPHTV